VYFCALSDGSLKAILCIPGVQMHLSTKAVVSLTRLSEARKDALGIIDLQYGVFS
jgi:hypothetical protein